MKHKPLFIDGGGMVVSHRNKTTPAQRSPCLVEEVSLIAKKAKQRIWMVLEMKIAPHGSCFVTEKERDITT